MTSYFYLTTTATYVGDEKKITNNKKKFLFVFDIEKICIFAP
jgi:hypothetical protein